MSFGLGLAVCQVSPIPGPFCNEFCSFVPKKKKVEDQSPDLPTSKTINCTYFEIKTLGYMVLMSPSVCETKNMHTMLICPSYLRDYYWDGHTPPAHYTWPMLGESWP